MKLTSLNPLTALWALLLVNGTASAATELDLRADFGYDSNVFNLNDTVGERDGLFTELDAELDAVRESPSGATLGVDLGVAARLFESGVSDGDEEKHFVRLRGDSGGKRRQRAFDWALRYRGQDSTYVSRFTGEVATDDGTPAGNEIGDRFDSAVGDARAAWHLRSGGYGRVSLEGSVEGKNYRNDYTALGLDRLDYMQFGLEPRYEHGRRADTFRIALPLGLRQYRDRRVSDDAGNPVPGTDLEYTFYGVEARYEHDFSRARSLQVTGGYEIRTDNGVGYRDRTRWNAGIQWTLRPAAKSRVSAGLEWYSRAFDRPVTGDPTIVDETPEKEGYSADLKYAAPFPGINAKNFSLLAEVLWESFENSNDVHFSYDRFEAFAGIRKQF